MNRSLARTVFLIALLAAQPAVFGADDAASKPSASKASADSSKAASDKAASDKPPAPPEPKFLLRYHFNPGETIRWQVEHQAQVKTTVSGTTQTAETTTTSIKVWKVVDCKPDGQATFVHSVESVDMRQKLTGRQEVRYNSRTDSQPPAGFQDVAKAVGVPLSEITLGPSGKVLKRVDKQPRPANQTTHITLPLPDEAVRVGHHWSVPYDTTVTTKDGESRAVKLRQHMTLSAVKHGVATIEIDNQVLSPVNDPAMDAQLVQSETAGKIRFDIDAGRILSQLSDGDKSVVGFQGEASSLHYVTRFTEKLMSEADQKKLAGPAAPAPASSAGAKSSITSAVAAPAAKPSAGRAGTVATGSAKPSTKSAGRPGTRQAKPTYRRR